MRTKNRKKYRMMWCILSLLLSVLLSALNLDADKQSASPLRGSADRLGSALAKAQERELEGLTVINKTYRLAPGTLAPAPDPEGYHLYHTAEEILALLDSASFLLDGREPIFKADTPFVEDMGVRCYYDRSILTLVWYQYAPDMSGRHQIVTLSEIFLSDASQFRRKLSDDVFGAGSFKFPTDMATEVNAVLATSGDFYRFRDHGFCVYEGQLCRLNAEKVDTCAIDENGDLLFIPAGTILTEEEANDYIRDKHINFTLSFGPIMIENHQAVRTQYYLLGEADGGYPRCCIAQNGPLHYLVAVSKGYYSVSSFTDFMMSTGVERCYALDGGQTGTIVMEGEALNPTLYGEGNGAQRIQSDIIYFASAIPESERG